MAAKALTDGQNKSLFQKSKVCFFIITIITIFIYFTSLAGLFFWFLHNNMSSNQQ